MDCSGPCLLALRFVCLEGGLFEASLRIHTAAEGVEVDEPTSWTIVHSARSEARSLTGVRLEVGSGAIWDLDELRVGTTWRAVTSGGEEADEDR